MATKTSLDSIAYKHNFLIEVVARVDFATPLDDLAAALPPEIKKAAVQRFPVEEPRPAFTREVLVSEKQMSTSKKEFTEWNFHGERREKRLTITPGFVVVSYKQYLNYDKLRDEFIGLLNTLFAHYTQIQVGRLGLRYINSIQVAGGNVLDWSQHLSKELLALFQVVVQGAEPTRIFHNYELVYGGYNLRFQFGMPNPDYPAPIRRKVFILDYDAYVRGVVENNDIPENLDTYHASIQELFERSITDSLREVMSD